MKKLEYFGPNIWVKVSSTLIGRDLRPCYDMYGWELDADLQDEVGTTCRVRWVQPAGSGGYNLQGQVGTGSRVRWVQPAGSGGYGEMKKVDPIGPTVWVKVSSTLTS